MTIGTCSCGEVFRDDNPLNPASDVILLHSQGGHSVTLWNQGCGRMLGPYSCCTVVQGDCLELMRELPDGCVDAVITDPNYGIGIAANPFRQKFEKADWDDVPASPAHIAEIRRVGCQQIIWGGNYFDLPPSQGFLLWNKLQSVDFSSAMCELAWWSEQKPAKVFDRHPASYEKFHPTQKPLDLMEWCIVRAEMPDTILDPFCGSGTTLVAAKKLNRHFLGFEIFPEYVEIARKRIALVEAQPNLFEAKAEQIPMEGM